MRTQSRISLAIALAVLGLGSGLAQAAPATGLDALATIPENSLSLKQVEYQVCEIDDGVSACRYFKDEDNGYASYLDDDDDEDVGTKRPERYETGSTQWWRAMDRQGRGGFGRR